MKKNYLEKIKNLIANLPEKDIPLAQKLYDNRNFEDLYNLVKSDVYKIEKELRKESPREEYANINISNLQELLAEVIAYQSVIDIEGSYNANMEDFE